MTFRSALLEFLASSPTQQQIADYKVSPEIQQRMSYLLDQNRKNQITYDEKREMEENLRLERFMASLKSKMRKRIVG